MLGFLAHGCSPGKWTKKRANNQYLKTSQPRCVEALGPYGTKASRLEYDRLITEWLAAGRPAVSDTACHDLTIAEICHRYWQFAKQHYRKNGKGTSEQDNIRYALRPLRQL
jgi:hypothetical protein